jgi:hypothetical protein
VEIVIGKLESHKSLGTDQIPAELNKAGAERLCSEIDKLINSVRNMEDCHSSGSNLLLHQLIKRVIRVIVIIMEESSYQLPIKFYPKFLWQG